MSARDVARLRLVAQGLVAPPKASAGPVDITRAITALQAQDLWSGLASLLARSAPVADVRSALEQGLIVRSWPMRGTLHFVLAEDLGWMLDATRDLQLAKAAAVKRASGVTEQLIDAARDTTTQMLRDSPRTRAELVQGWKDAGLELGQEKGYHLVVHLATEGFMHMGPMAGTQQLFVLTDRATPSTGRPGPSDRGEAFCRLALRFFQGHGPATAADFRRWAGLGAVDARVAVASAQPYLASLECDGVQYLHRPGLLDEMAAVRRRSDRILVLPGFDELIFGYQTKDITLDPSLAPAVFPTRNGVARPTVIHGGVVAGTWRRPCDVSMLNPVAASVEATARRHAAGLSAAVDGLMGPSSAS